MLRHRKVVEDTPSCLGSSCRAEKVIVNAGALPQLLAAGKAAGVNFVSVDNFVQERYGMSPAAVVSHINSTCPDAGWAAAATSSAAASSGNSGPGRRGGPGDPSNPGGYHSPRIALSLPQPGFCKIWQHPRLEWHVRRHAAARGQYFAYMNATLRALSMPAHMPF